MVYILRWEDDGLSDHLTLRVGWDLDCVTASARGSTNECVVVG